MVLLRTVHFTLIALCVGLLVPRPRERLSSNQKSPRQNRTCKVSSQNGVKGGGASLGRPSFQLFYFLGCQAEALLKNARAYYGH